MVSRDSEEEEQAKKLAEVQAALDGLVKRGQCWLKQSEGELGA